MSAWKLIVLKAMLFLLELVWWSPSDVALLALHAVNNVVQATLQLIAAKRPLEQQVRKKINLFATSRYVQTELKISVDTKFKRNHFFQQTNKRALMNNYIWRILAQISKIQRKIFTSLVTLKSNEFWIKSMLPDDNRNWWLILICSCRWW